MVDREAVMDDRERLLAALTMAVGVIREHFRVAMTAMALEEEIERSWRQYLRQSPEMRQIVAAMEGGGDDGQEKRSGH